MATFFHGAGAPEIQPDGALQTLYLMNPSCVGYASDGSAAATNMLLLNTTINSPSLAAAAVVSTTSHPEGRQQQQQLLGIPLQIQAATSAAQGTSRPPPIAVPHDVSAVHGVVPRIHHNLWTPGSNRPGMDTTTQQPRSPAMPLPFRQVLSLSLSPQPPNYSPHWLERDVKYCAQMISPSTGGGDGGADVRMSAPPTSASTTATAVGWTPGLHNVLMGSKYLRATQQLLEEVANVGKGTKDKNNKAAAASAKVKSSKCSAELTTADRQELQMKKTKLIKMLDEVEQWYRQYHRQMHIVVSSFEAVAGFGSATAYTSLALQTISQQFRCLKDAIAGQISATRKSLGDDSSRLAAGGNGGGGSRLRVADHHLRRQLALQPTWRPQRGLPERAVSVLRAWLFEHFLHPYPKDSDKIMLAKQTGLTRSQVSNWFINARVRLWKPMVEEMYLVEVNEHERQNGSDQKDDSGAPPDDNGTTTEQAAGGHILTSQDDYTDPKPPPALIPTSDPTGTTGIIRMSYGEDDYTAAPAKLKKAGTDEDLHTSSIEHSIGIEMEDFAKFGDVRREWNNGGYSLLRRTAAHGGDFGNISVGDIGRFDRGQFAPRYSGNGISLSLGLQHCHSLPLSGAQPPFMSVDMGAAMDLRNAPPVDHSADAFENINIQGRKGFAATLLPDFVA